MSFLQWLFGPPDVAALAEKRDMPGLIKALRYSRNYQPGIDGELQKHTDEEVRRKAAAALGKIGDALAVEPLMTALKGSDWELREAAGGALAKIGQPAVEPLVAALRSSDSSVRRAAAEALGRIRGIRDTRAVAPLVATLRDSDSSVRRAVAKVLGWIGDFRAVEPLVAALRDSDWQVRKEAAEALTRLGIPDDPETRAWHAVSTENWEGAEALGAVAVMPLTEALKNGNDYVRRAAALHLGHIGDARAVVPLMAALNDNERDVRDNAAWALGKIGDARAVEPLVAALKDSTPTVRVAAAEALVMILGDARAVEPLAAALKDSDKKVREAAAKKLGQIGDARAVEPLVTALRDNDMGVCKAALEALDRIGWKPGDDQMGASYWIAKHDVDRAARIGVPAVEPLCTALASLHTTPGEMVSVAEALGKIGDERAVEPLVAELRSPIWSIRRAAANALAVIYQRGTLDDHVGQMILRQRTSMAQPHVDELREEHRDQRHTRECGEDEDSTYYEHLDRGIGVEL